ncbi:MAG: hypothetical protein IPN86_21145 [Saprospiraceae bacterium]|nr:hypothetical protein [Saprospiraceae bacterium]
MQNGKTKSSTDPYNDSFGLEYFTYPINVKISYEISCFSNNKNVVEVDILEPGDWNLNIPIW